MANVSNTIALAVASIFLAAIVGYVIWRGLAAVRRVGTFFLLFTVGMAFYGGSKGFWRSVNFPRTDLDVAYLTDNDSRVWSTNFVHLAFTPASMVPQDAQIYLDYRNAASTNNEDWVTYTNATLAAFPNPLDFEFANATNYSWMCYTTWTPGAAEVTNGVVRIGWLLPMDGRTNAIVMLRTGVRYKSPLPYDAEVEYLSSLENASAGTSAIPPIYIDTGVALSSGIKISVTAAFNSTVQQIIGCYGGSFGRFDIGINNSSVFLTSIGATSTRSTADTNIHEFVLDAPNAMAYIDGVGVATGRFIVDIPGNVFLFTRGRGDRTPPLDYTVAASKASIKIYSCKIWQNGVLVRDFIPVRVGNVGYIYDRVSGQLFGNAGTGAFVLGPDKTN